MGKDGRKTEIQEVNEGLEEPDRTSEEVPPVCLAPEEGGDTSIGPPEHYEELSSAKPNSAREVGQLLSPVSARKGKPPHVS